MEKYIAIGLFVICTLVSIILREIIVKRHWKKLEKRLKMSAKEVFEQQMNESEDI